jgi:hypothetical protein
MKKVLAVAFFCAVSSFAAWDLFPVKEVGKGEAKLGLEYDRPAKKTYSLGINLGGRYSVIEGLEVALMFNNAPGGYVVKSKEPNPVVVPGVTKIPDKTGLNQPILGVRYWLPLGLGAFADLTLPFGSKDLVGDKPDAALSIGGQYSTEFNKELSLGSEVSFNKVFIDSAGVILGIAVELDYSLGSITPYFAVDISTEIISGGEVDAPLLGPGAKKDPDPTPTDVGISIGATYDISESLYVDAGLRIGIAGDANKDNTPITINVDVGFNF